jgi:short subunit dehydrogenase-like uncharacterized protein
MADRDFDLVIYGATGFTGRQAAQYLATQPTNGALRWALAGRDSRKLESLKAELGPPAQRAALLVGDSSDQVAVDAIAARTRVILNMAGPFALFGTPVVDACVRHQTHYADISGETPWVRDIIARYHEPAAADGTRIVPFCGFDSVPSDIGTLLVVRRIQKQLDVGCEEVRSYFQLYGGLNGGTFASLLNVQESGRQQEWADPFLLNPPNGISPLTRQQSRDPERARYDVDVDTWVAPFFMGPVNTRVVRRSAALFKQWSEPYGTEFTYQEYQKFEGPMARASAMAVTAGLGALDAAVRRPRGRRLLQYVLPKPGKGPSERTMEQGWFRCQLVARAADGTRLAGSLAFQGDPGNRATVTFACQSALCLAMDTAILPGGKSRGGVLTPATALGEPLAARLRRTPLMIKIGFP